MKTIKIFDYREEITIDGAKYQLVWESKFDNKFRIEVFEDNEWKRYEGKDLDLLKFLFFYR